MWHEGGKGVGREWDAVGGRNVRGEFSIMRQNKYNLLPQAKLLRNTIKYINSEIPEVNIPVYRGKRYEGIVPDTLDLQERAKLAVNGLTGPTDPNADYEIYWWVRFGHNPPVMSHDFNDHVQCKFLEALPLMRIISGSNLNLHIEKRWMEVALAMLGQDGMSYWPLIGRPWALNDIWYGENIPDRPEAPFPTVIYDGRLISAMCIWYLLNKNKVWKGCVEKKVKGLIDITIDKGEYAYFDILGIYLYKERRRDVSIPQGEVGCAMAWPLLSLVHAYRVFSFEPALKLADKLAHFLRYEDHQFGPNGDFLGAEHWSLKYHTHFHAHTYILLALLEYAVLTNNREIMEFVRRGYEYAKFMGEPYTGFFPEMISSRLKQTSETCQVADMIALGIKLTNAGVGDYFDDVDRWVRNQFAENQLTNVDWVETMAKRERYEVKEGPELNYERVAERNLGAFAGWPSANDWQGNHERGRPSSIMHCCTGNGTRTIYYIWENILDYDNGKLKINLLLNRASKWADINSHIPYTGQVDVKLKQEVNLSIRIPEWVKPEEVKVRVNGTIRKLSFAGRYAKVGKVEPGDLITFTFPIFERTENIFIEKQKYSIICKGNEIVQIDPVGQCCPFYQRAHYRKNQIQWRKVERFVSDKLINW